MPRQTPRTDGRRRRADQRQLEPVAVADGRLGARVAAGSVERGVDVDAADQQQPVELIERVVDLGGELGLGHQHHRTTACPHDLAKIRSRDQRGLSQPGAGSDLFKRRRHADHRPPAGP